jgi:hypothetical protein
MTRIGVALAVLLCACKQGTHPEPWELGSASVSGLFSVDGTPVGGAEVQLHSKTFQYLGGSGGETDHLLAATITSGDGSYHMERRDIDLDVCDGTGSVLLKWGPTRAVAYRGSPCQDLAGIDFALSTDTVVGRVMVNGEPVAGAGVDLRLCANTGARFCGERLDSASTAADGSFEVHFIGCYGGGDLLYTLTADIDEGFIETLAFFTCSSRQEIDFDISTAVEVTGTVYLDNNPVSGWEGFIVSLTEPCNFVTSTCAVTELASAVTDAAGKFHISLLVEGFQCPRLYFRARPPADWASPAPTPTSPGANGWERTICGPFEGSFYFVTPS